MNSVSPFGVAGSRRMDESDIAPRPERFADSERRNGKPSLLGEDGQLREQLWDRLRRPDRITGHDEHAVLDAIAEEGAAPAGEEVVLVTAELEVGERVGAVRVD